MEPLTRRQIYQKDIFFLTVLRLTEIINHNYKNSVYKGAIMKYPRLIVPLLFFSASLSSLTDANAAKCLNAGRLVDCKTVFGDKVYNYCVVDKFPSGETRCYDCESGVGGKTGELHCGGWSVGYNFSSGKPTGGAEDTKEAHRNVLTGKCENYPDRCPALPIIPKPKPAPAKPKPNKPKPSCGPGQDMRCGHCWSKNKICP